MAEVLVSSAKADLTLQDTHRNTALHLACSKVTTHRDGDSFLFPVTMYVGHSFILCKTSIIILSIFHCSSLSCFQGHETSALLILEKISDRNLINCTNAALQTYVLFCGVQANTRLCSRVIGTYFNSTPPPLLPAGPCTSQPGRD